MLQYLIVTSIPLIIYYGTIGALCRALDGNPSAMVESVTFWGEMDQVEAESFKDLLKTFGCKLQLDNMGDSGIIYYHSW